MSSSNSKPPARAHSHDGEVVPAEVSATADDVALELALGDGVAVTPGVAVAEGPFVDEDEPPDAPEPLAPELELLPPLLGVTGAAATTRVTTD